MLSLSLPRAEMLAEASYVLYGKLPNRPDFVRVNVNHPAALDLDSRIQAVLEKMLADREFCHQYENSGPVVFQYISKDHRYVMTGVIVPSRDSAGRLYPFVASAIHPNERVSDYLPVIPIAYEMFFDGLREQATNAVLNSVEALSCRQFLEHALRPVLSNADDLQLASSVVRRHADQVKCERIANLLATDQAGTTLHQALLNIAFYMDYLRRFDNRATNQIVTLPLPDVEGEQALFASAWLSLFVSLWPSRSAGPLSCSHLTVRGGDKRVYLVICVGSVSDSFVSLLLGCRLDQGMQLDLAHEHDAWKSHRMYAEASYALGRVLADPDYRLTALCRFLEDMSRLLETRR